MNRYTSWSFLAILLATQAGAEDFSAIEKTIKILQPTATISSIEGTQIPGVYEVRMGEFEPVYITLDGRHFLVGSWLEMTSAGRVVNRTQEKLRVEREKALALVPAADMITFKPAHPKRLVYVFTDVDCTYCRKFHTEVGDYNDAGIEIRYLAYPRGGVASDAFKKMQSIWCAKDRNAAITKVKAGGDIAELQCTSPVAGQYRLGQSLAVQGTPAVFTDQGEQIGGYLTPVQMKKALGL